MFILVRCSKVSPGLVDSPKSQCYTSTSADFPKVRQERWMAETTKPGEQGLTVPYGPTKGMMQALHLMRKSTPPRIDGNFLRLNKVAPGNEYKVIGALRFLGIIDEEGRPTEKSKLLKTKGAIFTSALQDIVRTAYGDVLNQVNGNGCSSEDIYNYFITHNGLGPEMSAKTTRFLVQLCQLAEIKLVINDKEKPSAAIKKGANGHRNQNTKQFLQTQEIPGFPMILALTPEMAAMETDELAQFFKKLKTALFKAGED